MGRFDVELKYTWRVSRSAWYVRLYTWVWDAAEEDITFCKIFWAYVFMWIGLPLKCLFVTLSAMGRAAARGVDVGFATFRRLRGREEELAPPERPVVPVAVAPRPIVPEWWNSGESDVGRLIRSAVRRRPRERGPVMRRMLSGIEHTTGRVAMRAQAVRFATGRAAKGVGRVAKGVGRGVRRGAFAVAFAVAMFAGVLAAVVVCSARALWMLTGRTGRRLAPVGVKARHAATRVVVVAAGGVWVMLSPARWAFAQIERTLSVVGQVAAVVLAVFLVAMYVAAAVFALGGAVFHPLTLLLILGGLAGTAAVGMGLGWLMMLGLERWFAPAVYHHVLKPTVSGVGQGARGIEDGAVGFGKVMLLGYKAVKSNTCPKIEVEE